MLDMSLMSSDIVEVDMKVEESVSEVIGCDKSDVATSDIVFLRRNKLQVSPKPISCDYINTITSGASLSRAIYTSDKRSITIT